MPEHRPRQQNSDGKVSAWKIGTAGINFEGTQESPALPKAVQDLNGDGRTELLTVTYWGSTSEGDLAVWYEIYQLKDGKYMDVTREFGNYYDKEIFPPIVRKIATLQKTVDSEVEAVTSAQAAILQYGHDYRPHLSEEEATAVEDSRKLARLEAYRDKLLRVLGRDPKAGETQAREWMKSGDPWLRDYGFDVVYDLEGCPGPVSAAPQPNSPGTTTARFVARWD